jgi:hypothetical protein
VLKIIAVTLALAFPPNGVLVCLTQCDARPSSGACHQSTATPTFISSMDCVQQSDEVAVISEAARKPSIQAAAAVPSLPSLSGFTALPLHQSPMTSRNTVIGHRCTSIALRI